MKILLVGEYSRLHNTLKEGLITLGHEVTIIGDGDEFKNFPVDLSIRPKTFDLPFFSFLRKGFYKVFKTDLAIWEKGLRFYFHLSKLKGFDVVQLINEKPIKTTPRFERYLLKKLFQQNKSTFLLSCGIDIISVEFMLRKKFRYSQMDPYFENPKLKPEYQYILDYDNPQHRKTHNLVFDHIKGVIASDMDYKLPLEGHPKFLGLVPNPVNCSKLKYVPQQLQKEIVIFLGINRFTYHKKGIPLFEEALVIIQKKYKERVKIITAESLPYEEYIERYNEAHIILDQVYAYDQGYNALEAMAKGKVVFTGAEQEFLDEYRLKEDEVCINALPNAIKIAEKISMLIDNPEMLQPIGQAARLFIEREHDHKMIAKRYLEKWS
ncbi:glycosyltransferase family protein [Ulvibacter antarcticus]|uniref:Glycosyltransferase involved in cell wall biosynthesis n=1 Tax=Ulvibacter antarcticus TaxID=442714 RepID=A0A3L9Y8N6_9FLAO|nr:glycosyltransferase [Ulvibacter antarcticus]RMA56734.1 glycosyltransferase involved in cell wall biosynthesis [Ulvibacter antarcticus]